MVGKYPWVYYKYEYSSRFDTYIVCAYPKHLIRSDDKYCCDEMKFLAESQKLFGNDYVLLSTETDLFSCSDNASTISGGMAGVDNDVESVKIESSRKISGFKKMLIEKIINGNVRWEMKGSH
jgi:hypothetical protein